MSELQNQIPRAAVHGRSLDHRRWTNSYRYDPGMAGSIGQDRGPRLQTACEAHAGYCAVSELPLSTGSAGMSFLMTISPSSKVSDIEALFDSYAVILSRKGQELQAGPLWQQIQQIGGIGASQEPIEPFTSEQLRPHIDHALELRMVQYEPPVEETRVARWPFWVESKLQVCFTFGDQWWQYDFSPGKTYTERLPPQPNERTTHPNSETTSIQPQKESSK